MQRACELVEWVLSEIQLQNWEELRLQSFPDGSFLPNGVMNEHCIGYGHTANVATLLDREAFTESRAVSGGVLDMGDNMHQT